MLELRCITLNPFEENTYVAWCPDTMEGVLIDPGAHTAAEEARLGEVIAKLGVKVRQLLLTHAHLDHVFGVEWAVRKYGHQPHYHALEDEVYQNAGVAAKMYGMPAVPYRAAGEELVHGQNIKVGEGVLDVRLVPGHSPGSVIFHTRSADGGEGWAVVGDTVFAGSIGRTDLPGGNHAQLIAAIREQVLTLPPHTVLHPGHGGATTVEAEAAGNPYL